MQIGLHNLGGCRWYGGYQNLSRQWCDNLSCRGWQHHPHQEGVHCLLNRFNDLFSYCLLPFEGSRWVDLITKHLLVPCSQFLYLTLLVIRFHLETLDFIKHLLPVLSMFLELGKESFMVPDGDSECCTLVKCVLHKALVTTPLVNNTGVITLQPLCISPSNIDRLSISTQASMKILSLRVVFQ
jgi:hypothetical protein